MIHDDQVIASHYYFHEGYGGFSKPDREKKQKKITKKKNKKNKCDLG